MKLELMNYKAHHAILLTILLLGSATMRTLHASDDRSYEYVARSVSIQKLYELADLLHILSHNRHSDALLDATPIGSRLLVEDGGRVSLEGYPGHIGLAGPEFLERFSVGFEPVDPLVSPMHFSNYSFSEVEVQGSDEVIELSGLMSLTGALGGTPPKAPLPFRALFVLERGSGGVDCRLKEFLSGADRHPILPISYSKMQTLHDDVFLDPIRSPLVEQGYCKRNQLDSYCDRIVVLEELAAVAKDLKTKTGWTDQTIHERMSTARIHTMSALHSLPYFLPPGHWNENEESSYEGEESISALIDQFQIDRWSVPSAVQSVLNGHRDAQDVERVQALMIRAWHYLLTDRLAAPLLFFKDLEKARIYPTIEALEVIDILGHGQLRDYPAAQKSMRRLHALGPNTVLRHYLHETQGEAWYAHGQEMQRFHEHGHALMGLYLGTRFRSSVDRLRILAEEASKMGEDDLVVDCLWSILASQENEADAGVWTDLALAEARLGIDPTSETVNVEALEKGRTAEYYQVMSLYHHYGGRESEAEELLSEAELRFGADPALLSARAELSEDPIERRKLLRHMVDLGTEEKGELMFKRGIIDHRTASVDSILSPARQRQYYKDAIYNYLNAVRLGFDRALGYTKVAEAYVSIDDLPQATFYYNNAINGQERGMSIYFTQALLNLCVGDMSEFSDDLHLAEQKGIEDDGSERDVSLFRFMENIDDINTLISLADESGAVSDKRRQRVDELSNTVKDRITEMFLQLTPQDSAYAAFSRVMLESLRGYVERDPSAGKARYRENNIQEEGVIGMMERSSDIPLQFFKENPIMAPLSRWNREFEKKIHRHIRRPDGRTGLEYLRKSRTFSDPYNYL